MASMRWGLGKTVFALLAISAYGQAASYFEFGTVVAISKRDVEVQIFDQRRQRTVQRSFALDRDTRADVVHVGDTVEVIYATGTASDGAEYVLRRLVALHGEIPVAGPGPAGTVVASIPVAPARKGSVPAVPSRKPVKSAGTGASGAAPAVPNRSNTTLGSGAPAGTASGARAVDLGSGARASVPGVVNVPLGVSNEVANGLPPKARAVTQAAPGEGCNRDKQDWPGTPIGLAVLDFRYPTEREEAHDIGQTGGGSGTAVADIVYSRLQDNPAFQLSRGDREKVYRMDFAGAARVGRQLGVDAVILGTFAPVESPSPDPDFPAPVTAYTLRAGVVDTCTGELLYRLSSISCAAAGAAGQSTNPLACPGDAITARAASDPEANVGAFQMPVKLLLSALDRTGPAGSLGSVTAVGGGTVSFRTAGNVQVGAEVSIHASRLAKNPSTYTLHRYQEEEVGRVTVRRISGGVATGTYQGDVPAVIGDAVEPVAE